MKLQKDKIMGVCKCGHKQQEHNTTEYQVGHGSCKKCDCSRFTWVAEAGDSPAFASSNRQTKLDEFFK